MTYNGRRDIHCSSYIVLNYIQFKSVVIHVHVHVHAKNIVQVQMPYLRVKSVSACVPVVWLVG